MWRCCVLACFLAGCSTAPVADFLDYARPARSPAVGEPLYGGVGPTPTTIPPPVPPGSAPAVPAGPSTAVPPPPL